MITFFAYAEDDSDGERLQRELYDFINDEYNQGVLITADKLRTAINRFKDNVLVNNFLKG
jgi:hypothetical protein